MNKQNYRQVPAKVIRYVDENIKDLVELLSTFDGIEILECSGGCEGYLTEIDIDCGTNYDSPDYLEYDAHKMADIAQFFYKVFLMSRHWEKLDEDIDISIHWVVHSRSTVNPSISPVLKIEFPNKCVKDVHFVLSDVAPLSSNRDREVSMPVDYHTSLIAKLDRASNPCEDND
ncbi:MAG: hypothetical protein ABSB31_08660 [Dehalococcoidia bacterium]|jgi:hypothetical protein